MDSPRYTVTVASLTRGWSYTTTHGETPDTGDPVHLGDDLRYRWGYAGGVIPNRLGPLLLTAKLVAKTAGDVPTVDKGDLVTVDLRVGTTGQRIIAPPPMRVTTVELEIDENIATGDPDAYAATLTIAAADVTADAETAVPVQRNIGPGTTIQHTRWRACMAQIGKSIGVSIGCPSWWPDAENQLSSLGFVEPAEWKSPAAEILTRLLASHQPSNYDHVLTPGYDAASAYAAGYRWVGPDDEVNWRTAPGVLDGVAWKADAADPATPLRYYLVPASRRVDGTGGGLPLAFEVRDGTLTLVPSLAAPTARGHGRQAVDAGWCELPAVMRRSREHRANLVQINGERRKVDASVSPASFNFGNGSLTYTGDTSDGLVVREVNTWLELDDTPDSVYAGGVVAYASADAPLVAANYLSDPSSKAAWVYDAFTLVASRIPQDIADDLLPKLAPRFPGETDGDGQALRHLTIYRPAAASRAGADLVSGFVTAGELQVVDGDLYWTFTLTPGLPQWVGATPTPVTVGDVAAAGYGTTTAPDIDPLIRVADLALID